MGIMSRITSLLTGVPENSSSGEYQRISGAEARERLATRQEIALVDVRTEGEHRARRIAGSLLIPLQVINQQAPKLLPNKDTPLIVYCQSGMRSRQAVMTLLALGYTQVHDLGGLMSWPYETVSG